MIGQLEKNIQQNKRKKMIKIAVCFSCIVLFLLAAFDVRLKSVVYQIDSGKIHKTIQIALITDLHSCEYGKKQEELLKEINQNKPDVILLGGDIFDDNIGHQNAIELLDGIAHKYPCYYVTGNHEYWSGKMEQIIKILKSYSVSVLQGATDVLEINGQKISISGIDDPESEQYEQLEQVGLTRDSQNFTILLTHRPSYIQSYREEGFDLVLAGHAHGGQWRLPFCQNGLYAPDEGWFPSYSGGEFDFPDCKMIVSRGLARESTRIPRIFNRPELVFIKVQ